MKIKKGDTVKVLVGKDRGKSGKVVAVLPKKERIIIEGINMYKKHIKPRHEGEKGQTVETPRSIHNSNVKVV